MRTWLLGLMVAVAAVGCGDDDRPPLVRDGGGADTSIPGVDSGPPGCTPGQYACAGSTRYLCGEDGVTRLNEEVCPAACSPTEGCVACMPGQRQCNGTVSMVCAPDGSGFVSGRDCAEFGSTCGSSGFCTDACAVAESTRSNIGCEYWPVPLPNLPNIEADYDFRVVVANPNDTAANVRVFRGTSMVTTASVPAGGLQELLLPWIDGLSFEIGSAETWTSLSVSNGAYRLLSDLPVTAVQFNPFEYDAGGASDFSFTNDASLLLPAHSFTGNYYVSSFVPLSIADPGLLPPITPDTYGKIPGYVAVVGVTQEPTTVSVALSAAIVADAGGRFPATGRGGVVSFTLARGEVAILAAAPPPDCMEGRPGRRSDASGRFFCNEADFDLTGSRVTANRPVAVFGGHTCAYVPYWAQACDHLESQMPPLETWGRNYVSGPMRDTGVNSVNILRVMAAQDGTNITVDPPQGGTSTFTLGAGQWREIEVSSPFRLTGDRGILATQYLVGQLATMPEPERGDPSMVALPPVEQYRSDYTFVTPNSYNTSVDGQSYLLVVRPVGLAITLDGSAVTTTWTTVGDREVGIIPLSGGTHRMEAAMPFGVMVYGMGITTSYAYPAGLNLEEIFLI